MDPADAELYASIQVYDNIFSKLLNVTADYKFVPNLAHTWMQEDAKTWVVDLVDNAVFHNGEPLTAHDVKFSMDRVKHHPNGVFFSAFKSTEVLGKYRVRFHLFKPFGAFEAALALFSEIVNEKAVTSSNPKLHPIGSGPYRMKEWVQNDHVTLVRWKQYFKTDKPYLDEVVFRANWRRHGAPDGPSDRATGLDPAGASTAIHLSAPIEPDQVVPRPSVSPVHADAELLEAPL
jgi:peptide/nickel transport system substrate-binding protein